MGSAAAATKEARTSSRGFASAAGAHSIDPANIAADTAPRLFSIAPTFHSTRWSRNLPRICAETLPCTSKASKPDVESPEKLE